MSRAPKPEQMDVPVMVGRRSTRISVAVPITLSGKDPAGNEFREKTFTLNVNKHGAEIATSHALVPNSEVTIENSTLSRKSRARVVLRRERRTPNSPYEVSLELIDPENIWGVRFPPADWEQSAAPKPGPAALTEPQPEAAAGQMSPSEAAEAVLTPENLSPRPNGHEPHAASPDEPPAAMSEPPRAAENHREPSITETAVEFSAPRFASESETAANETLRSEMPAPKLLVGSSEREVASVDDQVHAASAAVARLSELVIRLEAASAQVEGMLAKAGEARARLQSEMDRAPSEAGRVGKIAGEGALEEFRARLSTEWESHSAQWLADMKRRVEDQVSSAIASFGKEAGAHLARLTQESGPELESKQKQTVSATKEQIAQIAASAANEFRGTIGKLAEETSASWNSRMQSSLEQTIADAVERLGQSLREQSASLLQGEASPLPRLRQQMQEETSSASMQFKDACVKEIERASSNLKEEMMKAVTVLTGAAADANSGLWESAKAIKHDLAFKGEKIRAQLAEISSASEEGFKNYLHVRVKGAQEEMQMNLRVLADKSAQEFSERLQKQTDSLLETFGPQLQRQAEDAAVLCKGSLEIAARESLSETRKQIAGLTSDALGTFSTEMRSQMEQFRNQLGAMIRETFASGAQELQNRLHQAGEEEARAALSRIQSEGADASARVVADIRDRASEAKAENERVIAEIKDRSALMNVESERTVASTRERAEAAARQASDAVYKQLGMATVVLKDWSDQTASRLESQFRESMAAFEKHVQELANRSLEASRIQSDATMQETRRRLEQATRILRGESAEPSPKDPSS